MAWLNSNHHLPYRLGFGATSWLQRRSFSVRAGFYEIDPLHTRVTWTTSHFGMSRYSGQLVELNGRLEINPSDPTRSALSVTVPMDKGGVFQPELDKRLLTEFFDTAKFPTATFSSTSIERVGDREVKLPAT